MKYAKQIAVITTIVALAVAGVRAADPCPYEETLDVGQALCNLGSTDCQTAGEEASCNMCIADGSLLVATATGWYTRVIFDNAVRQVVHCDKNTGVCTGGECVDSQANGRCSTIDFPNATLEWCEYTT